MRNTYVPYLPTYLIHARTHVPCTYLVIFRASFSPQFCANDADTLAKAASYVEPICDCIDINLGCPQSIARRGHYGAFLQDEWDLLSRMGNVLMLIQFQWRVGTLSYILVLVHMYDNIRVVHLHVHTYVLLMYVLRNLFRMYSTRSNVIRFVYFSVKKLRQCVSVPVSCKIRIFSDVSKSIDYARMLEAAGCQLLTVHGRTREQKGPLTGTASWTHIKAIKYVVPTRSRNYMYVYRTYYS